MEQHKPSPNIGSFFQVGGSLEQELPSYIERKADKDLYESLKRGEFCYVLSARQMGKSSLKVRTMNLLAEEDESWATASVDLTSIGTTGFTNAEWYNSFLFEIADALDIEQDFDSWWESYANLTPIARMSRFWEDFLLKEIPDKPILICIDEIDTMLSLSK
ncbi:MAG: AAA-like domain-containing protein, partial [Bacteroidota bacterium]